MTLIKGKPVKLYEKTETGVDDFGHPIYSETPVIVENVLIEPATNDDITSNLEILGKYISYTLHIPKTDNHNWKDAVVEFNNQKFKTFGDCLVWDSELTPLYWNKKVKVEKYE